MTGFVFSETRNPEKPKKAKASRPTVKVPAALSHCTHRDATETKTNTHTRTKTQFFLGDQDQPKGRDQMDMDSETFQSRWSTIAYKYNARRNRQAIAQEHLSWTIIP